MFLYHFTDFFRLQEGGTILAEGLKPQPQDDPEDWQPAGVVWFTTEAEPVTWWFEQPSECRITAVIPTHDRRLMKYEKWLRKWLRKHLRHRLDEVVAIHDAQGAHWRAWYIYFGDVPLDMLQKVDPLAAPQRCRALTRAQPFDAPIPRRSCRAPVLEALLSWASSAA